jgi:hypothetical protein
MFSRKYSPTFSRFVPDLPVTDTATHTVASSISGSAGAMLAMPTSSNPLDGETRALFFSGRIILHTGATPGNFIAQLAKISGGIQRGIGWVSNPLPANVSGLVVPFSIRVNAVLDVATPLLYGTVCSVVDPIRNQNFGWSPFSCLLDDVNNMQIIAQYTFSAAPLAGTQVQITEFRFGF